MEITNEKISIDYTDNHKSLSKIFVTDTTDERENEQLRKFQSG